MVRSRGFFFGGEILPLGDQKKRGLQIVERVYLENKMHFESPYLEEKQKLKLPYLDHWFLSVAGI